ncbi:MAG: beta-ketoacyl-ACP synthase [Gammaproteobacteria bacterium]
MTASIPALSVPVTAYATVCAAGMGNAAFYRALSDNRSRLGQLTLLEIAFETPVGEVSGPLPVVRGELADYNSRNARMALAALNQAQDGLRAAVEAAKRCYGAHRVGVVIGTSTSGLYETESAYEMLLEQGRMPDDFHFLTRHAYQATPRLLQLELGLAGPCFAVSTACSSGAKAVAAGQRLIANGVCDAVLTGGVDTLCRLTLRGFHSLELVSGNFCRPMDKRRDGINIGEGAGLLLLERPGSGNRHFPHVLAVGESSDAHHMSSPHPEGIGAALAMTHALALAGFEPGDIDYLNLHATATPVNDQVEARAVFDVFGGNLPVSGCKGITGHTLGASGAIEAVAALLALEHQFIPGTCGLKEVDESFGCRVIKDPVPDRKLKRVMSNSFGFGGNNASMIFSRRYEN